MLSTDTRSGTEIRKIIQNFSVLAVITIAVCSSGCINEDQRPIVSVDVGPTSGYQPLQVSFSINATDPDGSIETYFIDFGDGNASHEREVTHTYTKAGTYTVNITVTDDKGYSTSKHIIITVYPNDPPTASISANITSGKAPLTVYFMGSGNDSDGYIVSYYWDFGDGHTSDMQNPIHTFTEPGKTYTVVFTVTDNHGAIARSICYITTLPNKPPVASVYARPTSGEAPLTVRFTGSGTDKDGKIVSYYWDFGDGHTDTQQNPTHTYLTPGTYTVTLTVTDDNGATATDTVEITVTEHQYRWVKVASFSGYSDKVTDTFTITGSKFKIVCTVNGDPNYGYWYIYIYPEGMTTGYVFHQTIALDDYPSGYASETSYCYAGPGVYYCKIGAANIDGGWKVDIYDWR